MGRISVEMCEEVKKWIMQLHRSQNPPRLSKQFKREEELLQLLILKHTVCQNMEYRLFTRALVIGINNSKGNATNVWRNVHE